MTEDSRVNSGREEKLHDVLAAYYQGADPDRQALLDRHPELVAELADFFAVQDELYHMAKPLRDLVSEGPYGGDQFELNSTGLLRGESVSTSSAARESLRSATTSCKA